MCLLPKRHLTKRALDAGDSVPFSGIFLASSFSCSQTESTPAPAPVTQTVRCAKGKIEKTEYYIRPNKKQNRKENKINFIEAIKNINQNLLAVIIPTALLVLGIIGFFIKRRFSQRDAKKSLETEKSVAAEKEFSEALKGLTAVFDETLVRLNPKEQQAPGGVLSEIMPKHKVAYDKFRPIFKRIKGAVATECLDWAWKEYYDTEKYGDSPFAAFDIQKFGGDKRKAKKAAIDKIENLLKAAKTDPQETNYV